MFCGVYFILKDVFGYLLWDDGFVMVSYVVLFGFLVVFLLLIFIVLLVGFFGMIGVVDIVLEFVFDVWLESVVVFVVWEIYNVLMVFCSDLLIFGVVVVIWFVFNGVEVLRIVLNRVYR